MYSIRHFLFLLILISCKSTSSFEAKDYVVIQGCKIFEASSKDRLYLFPGNLCEFDHKGNVYSYVDGNITKYSIKENKLLWATPARVYHSMEHSDHDEKLYYFSSEIFYQDKTPYLGATLNSLRISDGEKILNWKSSENLKELKSQFDITPFVFLPITPEHGRVAHNAPDKTRVFLDANQIQVITSSHPLLKSKVFNCVEGDLLLTFMDYSLVAIYSPTENTFRGSIKIPNSFGQIHTVSFLSNGNLLVYINDSDREIHQSSARELKGENFSEVFWQFPTELTENFYSAYFSSIQKVSDGLYFLADNSKDREGLYYINSSNKVLHSLPTEIDDPASGAHGKIYRATTLKKSQLEQYLFGKN